MIDHFTIFTKGGLVLWSYTQATLKGSPIDSLIRTALVEERSGENSFNFDQYSMKWTFANEFDLTFVVAYQRILQLLYLDELLELVKRKFCDRFKDQLKSLSDLISNQFDFTDIFLKILNSIEAKSKRKREEAQAPRKFHETEKGKKQTEKLPNKGKQIKEKEKEIEIETEDQMEQNPPIDINQNQNISEEERRIQENIEKLKQRTTLKGSKGTKTKSKPQQASPKGKQARTWDDSTPSAREKEKLDFSKKYPSSDSINSRIETPTTSGKIDVDDWSHVSDEDTEDSKGFFSFLKNKVQSISGTKPLEASDLEPVMDIFRQHLITKNVAADIADKLCQSVQTSLEGKKLSTLQIKSTIKAAIEEALIKILTPKKTIDILREIQIAKSQGRPYCIVFVGVNGVGKSTNLAKVCSYIQDNNHSVMIAACDTFRSGAVEQLLVHAHRLNVPVFERGYRTDPTAIALDALKEAKKLGKDVLLVDTAGRMQDNEPLMQALSKLVNTTKPDLVLFVGEAIVGNDAVDQLTKYNQALSNLSKDQKPRLIDGIILTKFDTIDDKVGAAISMVYATGQPIVFLGVGQQYTDLRRMNVQVVTKALLKGA